MHRSGHAFFGIFDDDTPIRKEKDPLLEFLADNPDISYELFLTMTDKMNLDQSQSTRRVFSLASRMARLMTTGLAAKEGTDTGDVDPVELAMGIDVEREHIEGDDATAKRIALDHLSEDPRYYSKLALMEQGALDDQI